MRKVFQTIIDKDKGNCMQAVVASLFDLELSEVPNFIEFGTGWYKKFDSFFIKNGYCYLSFINRRENDSVEFMKKIANYDGGINGYLFGVVNSQTYENSTHAVVIDLNLNIVHDPNPNQKALNLTPNDVIGFYITKDFYIDLEGNIKDNYESL